MKSLLIGSLALALTCGTALAQRDDDRKSADDRGGGRPEAIDQALKHRYGKDAKTQIIGAPSTVNGVRVYPVRVTNKRGESTAMVTEYGDFHLSGMPSNFKGMPEAVRNTQTLFKANPENAEQFIADGYFVDLQQGGKVYRLRYDAIGRLREIMNPEEVERVETTNFKKADERNAGKVQELAERQVPEGSKIKDVYVDPRNPGFYVAKYTGPDGKEILVITDEQGNVYQTRTEIDAKELPRPVRDAFERMFDDGKIKWAYRTQYQFYQFDQQTPDGDRVTFKVRPNGQIMDVSSVQAEEEERAVQAKYREGEKVGPQKDDSRDR
jgi:YD repeat-containing protein